MNGDYLHVDLPATVITDSVSDAMIVQKEEASDSNPWENVDHNDRLCLETAAAAPSLFRAEEEAESMSERRGDKEQLPLSFNAFKPFLGIFKRDPSATTKQKEGREAGEGSQVTKLTKVTSLQTA